MEYSPPPFFKQGPSARARLLFFAVLSITLMVADGRFDALTPIRKGLGTVLYPIQRAVLYPEEWSESARGYLVSQDSLEKANKRLEAEKATLARSALVAGQLEAENAQLRKLLGARESRGVQSVAAEILYDARDIYSRKIVVDRGSNDTVKPGLPVIDEAGVIGQVTRVFPFSSEVTLLTDRDQAVPVQILRSGVRGVAYGGAEGGRLDLRFMAANADVQKDDMLVTSGLDGVYVAGLPVARVERVERNAAYAFARILCVPIGGVDRNRHVLILLPAAIAAPPPPADAPPDIKRRKGGKT